MKERVTARWGAGREAYACADGADVFLRGASGRGRGDAGGLVALADRVVYAAGGEPGKGVVRVSVSRMTFCRSV